MAGEVVRLIRGGVPAEEIVVVARSLARVESLFGSVFARYGIALAGHGRTPFTHTRLGRSVRALARCALLGEEASAGDLLDVLRAPGRLERLELADALEAEVRREALSTAGTGAVAARLGARGDRQRPRRRGSRRRARVAGATAVRVALPRPCRRTRCAGAA